MFPQKKLSFEFFPTRTPEGREKQVLTRRQLGQFKPAFFSCTSGAGGSTRSGTLQAIGDMLAEGTPAAPHLPCIGMSRDEVAALLDEYKSMGVRHIVALRGDIPSGVGLSGGGMSYAAELVAFIRERYGRDFHIEVAAYPEYHPQSRSAEDDMRHFVSKVEAGADSAITQFFYNADAYFRFVDDARGRGVEIPIVPGIMPIASFSKLSAAAETAVLRRRHRVDQGAGAGCGNRNVLAPAARRRARPAFLHPEPGRPGFHHLPASRLLSAAKPHRLTKSGGNLTNSRVTFAPVLTGRFRQPETAFSPNTQQGNES